MSISSADHVLADAPGKNSNPAAATLIVGGLVAIAALWLWISRALLPGELISPVSPNLFAAAVFVGVSCGVLLAARMLTVQAGSDGDRSSRRLDAIVGALIPLRWRRPLASGWLCKRQLSSEPRPKSLRRSSR